METRRHGNSGFKRVLAGLLLMSTQGAVQAHHVMDGELPRTIGQGFLSGLAHPVIGLDHLAFIVAIGLLSLRWSRGLVMPLIILPAALLGSGVHFLGWDLPAVEILVALSVVAFGLLLLLSRSLPLLAICGLAGFCGVTHGYAFAEAIIGAHRNAIGAYLVGFTLVQLTIAVVVRQGALYLWRRSDSRPAPAVRFAGMGISAVGLAQLLLGIKG